MRYAIVENGFVVSILWFNPEDIMDYQNYVPCFFGDTIVGDLYTDGSFWHNGERLMTPAELMAASVN